MRALLMATRVQPDLFDDGLEAEPVLIDTDDPRMVVLVRDDGERLELDAGELRIVLEEAA